MKDYCLHPEREKYLPDEWLEIGTTPVDSEMRRRAAAAVDRGFIMTRRPTPPMTDRVWSMKFDSFFFSSSPSLGPFFHFIASWKRRPPRVVVYLLWTGRTRPDVTALNQRKVTPVGFFFSTQSTPYPIYVVVSFYFLFFSFVFKYFSCFQTALTVSLLGHKATPSDRSHQTRCGHF